jgi:hypothetical protein
MRRRLKTGKGERKFGQKKIVVTERKKECKMKIEGRRVEIKSKEEKKRQKEVQKKCKGGSKGEKVKEIGKYVPSIRVREY